MSELPVDPESILVELKQNSNKMVSIIVRCPRCGKTGYLRITKSNIFTVRYVVIHNGSRGCTFGITSDGYELLDYLYRKYRLGEVMV